MLPTAELTSIRATFAANLPDTCSIMTNTPTSNGAGGWTDSWAATQSNVACRLSHKQGYEQIAGGALQPFSSWVVTLAYGTTITTANRVRIGGVDYNVIGQDSAKSDALCVRVTVERV